METIEELEFFLEKRTANYRILQAMKRRQAWLEFVIPLEFGYYTQWRNVLTEAPLPVPDPLKPWTYIYGR